MKNVNPSASNGNIFVIHLLRFVMRNEAIQRWSLRFSKIGPVLLLYSAAGSIQAKSNFNFKDELEVEASFSSWDILLFIYHWREYFALFLSPLLYTLLTSLNPEKNFDSLFLNSSHNGDSSHRYKQNVSKRKIHPYLFFSLHLRIFFQSSLLCCIHCLIKQRTSLVDGGLARNKGTVSEGEKWCTMWYSVYVCRYKSYILKGAVQHVRQMSEQLTQYNKKVLSLRKDIISLNLGCGCHRCCLHTSFPWKPASGGNW